MTRTLWPARIAVGLMLVLQTATVSLLPVSTRTRGMAWSYEATLVVGIAIITGTAAWGWRHARAPMWLAGSMAVALVALSHADAGFHGAVPPVSELVAMYLVAGLLWSGSILDR